MKKNTKINNDLPNDQDKTVWLEFPKELLEGLDINMDGTVDTLALLTLLTRLEKSKNNRISLGEHIQLMLNIFDESRAADKDPN